MEISRSQTHANVGEVYPAVDLAQQGLLIEQR